MRTPPSSPRRRILAAALPTFAILAGVQFGCVQPQVMLSARTGPAPAPQYEDTRVIITIGPPPIPIYEQPDLPGDGYIWTPGYWAWDDGGYFWVPGTWVMAPEIGLLWTPGYWGWGGRAYVFHAGYWGPHVGFYGGVNYGHGYGGSGFDGGHWQGRDFAYNRAVTHVTSPQITHVYNSTVIVNNTHIAYNGGEGGLRAAPTPQEQSAEREHHVPLTQEQKQHHQRAGQDQELRASTNRGKPPVAATRKPSDFSPEHVVPAQAPGGPVAEAPLKAAPRTMAPPFVAHAPEAKPVAPPEPIASAPPPAPQDRPAGPRPLPQASEAPATRPEQGSSREQAPPNRGKVSPKPEQTRKPNDAPAARPTPGPRPGSESSPGPNPGRKSKPRQPGSSSDPNSPYYLPPPGRP